MRGDQDAEVQEFAMRLRNAGVPTVSIEMNSPEELGAEMFKWEIATALACAPLNVNPFDEPDVQEGRGRVSEMLEVFASKHQWPARTARVREKGIELYAEGDCKFRR
jgi:transaldolase / glucose-6-phosphate isomerase